MDITGTFPEGILVNGTLLTDFVLEEHQFRHSLELASDPAIELQRLDDPVYYQAAVLSRRLVVSGLGRPLTPGEVMGLSGADGQAVMAAAATLEQRRKAFRGAAQAAAAGPDSPAETGH